MKLTSKEVRGLQLPAGKSDHITWDDEIPGLGLRMRAGGSRKWVFQYALGEKQWRMTLGAATDESFKTASRGASTATVCCANLCLGLVKVAFPETGAASAA